MKKKIKIKFVDFWPSFDERNNFFTNLLNNKYDIEFSDTPDYIFAGVYGKQEFVKYDCIRICFIGENIRPNFDFFDYALGFDWMNFGDRYHRLPLYRICDYWPDFLHRRSFSAKDLLQKTAFCNFVYSNAKVKQRDDFFYLLSSYKQVDSGGRYMNNVGGSVLDKRAFQRNYKFSIAFENSSISGYTTEKIGDAFAAYTIPIYWGSPDIAKEFNTDAFINCHDYDSFDDVVNYIKKIDNDDELFLKMINQPVFNYGIIPEYLTDEAICAFLDNIFSQDLTKASRRPSKVCFRWEPYRKYMKRQRHGLKKHIKLFKERYF